MNYLRYNETLDKYNSPLYLARIFYDIVFIRRNMQINNYTALVRKLCAIRFVTTKLNSIKFI
jgi:hypothetical protein